MHRSSPVFVHSIKLCAAQMIWKPTWPLLPVLCALSSCAWPDHPTSRSLQRELAEESKQGLALATFSPARSALQIDYFNGQTHSLQPTCCPYTHGRTISRNRIVMVDMTVAPKLDPLRDPAGFVARLPAYGGPVVAMDTRGVVIARSMALFRPTIVSLSPDLEHFVLMGVNIDGPGPPSVIIGAFHEKKPRTLLPVQVAEHYERPEMQPALDWSPDGKTVLFSHQRTVSLIDQGTGTSRKVADGAAAVWSPSGNWIAYISVKSPSNVTLLNLATGSSKMVDAGKEGAFPLEWSPDGKYLLIRAGNDISYGGRAWIYRPSDGAWVPATAVYLSAGLHWHWLQTSNFQAK